MTKSLISEPIELRTGSIGPMVQSEISGVDDDDDGDGGGMC